MKHKECLFLLYFPFGLLCQSRHLFPLNASIQQGTKVPCVFSPSFLSNHLFSLVNALQTSALLTDTFSHPLAGHGFMVEVYDVILFKKIMQTFMLTV